MNLRQAILEEHSKAQTSKIVDWIGNNQQRFDELFLLFLNDEPIVIQRAAWPMSYAVTAHPNLITKHFGNVLKNLQKPNIHDSVKRNTVRLLQEVTIPEKYHGDVMNTCFNYISSPVEKPAIKAFSLTILENLSSQYPDIKQELKTIIEDRWEHEGAAFRSRAKKILKRMDKK